MKPAYSAAVLSLAALCAGCAGGQASMRLPGDELPLLSLEEARGARHHADAKGQSPYWYPGKTADLAPRPGPERSYASRGTRKAVAAASPGERAVAQLQPTMAAMQEPSSAATEGVTRARNPAPPPAPDTANAGVTPVVCPAKDEACTRRVNELVADPSRQWLHKRPTPAEDISGARLFAFHQLRPALSCAELQLAIKETGAAQEHFGSIVGSPILGASIRQRLEVQLLLAQTVGADLKARQAEKCLSAAGLVRQPATDAAQGLGRLPAQPPLETKSIE